MNVYYTSYLHTGRAARNQQKTHLFYLLYGRDARLPSDEIVNATVSHRGATNLVDHISEMSESMAAAWDCAKGEIKKAQQRQKRQHDKHLNVLAASRCGEAYKFPKPFKGPFCITSLYV